MSSAELVTPVALGPSFCRPFEFCGAQLALTLPFIADDYLQIALGRRYGPPGSWAALAADFLYRCRAASIVLTWLTEPWASFRGYADYMQTAGLEAGLRQLLALAAEHRVAVMCAEAVPWRCHRSLIADALSAKSVPVKHLLSAAKAEPHRMTAFAKAANGRVTYPSEQTNLF